MQYIKEQMDHVKHAATQTQRYHGCVWGISFWGFCALGADDCTILIAFFNFQR